MPHELAVVHCRAISSVAWDVGRVLLYGTACLLVAPGCLGRPQVQVAPISGTVTYLGKPLSHGQIIFMHSSGKMGIC